ncbi:MAG: AMP-binding protein [Flavobacteriales bacterium]|jgi:D-alanine--poly(phosphoribitol) ligase subunit 1|nr:AMP-binding protein [Flavobacteriales bacterium]
MRFCFNKKEFVEKEIEADKLAVIGEDFSLTWRAFNARVDELITVLEQNECHQLGTPVIIYGHKSANMLVAIYALMKLKITYIPVDVIYPLERIEKIKTTVDSQLIINTTEETLAIDGINQISLLKTNIKTSKLVNETLIKEEQSDPVVYIIFTSGSTGEPKGVQISSEAVQSFVRWMGGTDFNFSTKDTFINTALLSFDLSVFEVMTFAHLGATIMLNSSAQGANPSVLMERIEQYNGSIWVSTPSFALTYARIKDTKRFQSITTFLFCGEVLPNALVKKLFSNYSFARVINTYGPTEATVATTVVEITPEILEEQDPLPVGKVKEETEILIEDKEIIIVGPNVSIGYVNNKALNDQKFRMINHQRAFKTGDQGYLENGYLYFYGRNDDLVKLHGYRIELNEITGAFNNLDYVVYAETLPLKRKGITKKIASFIQLEEEGSYSVEQLKAELSKTLPHYMIPGDVILVDKIPLNQNGKVDKKELLSLYLNKG